MATKCVCQICGATITPAKSERWQTWKRFCSRSCAGKGVARYMERTYSREDRQRFGRQGAAALRAISRGMLLERLGHLSRNDAIFAAYKMGRHANKTERLRVAKGHRPQAIKDVA